MKVATKSPPPKPAISTSTPTNELNQKRPLPRSTTTQASSPPPTPGKAWRGKRRARNRVDLNDDEEEDDDNEPPVPLFLPQRHSILGREDQQYAGFNRAGENQIGRNASSGSIKIANDSLCVRLRARPLFGTMIHPDQLTPESPESQIKEPQLPFLFEDESTEIEPRVATDFDGQ